MIPILFMNSQRLVCNLIQETLPQIKHIEYWSDGCAGQYKILKNVINLCNYANDLGFHAIWSFFGTSHGNSPCDAIRGTTKKKIARTSFQIPVMNQILTFKAVEEFCKKKIVGMLFCSIYKKEMVQVREVLDGRYLLGDTVPGKTSCHYFEPSSITSIKGKQLNNEYVHTIKDHSFFVLPTVSEIALTLKPNDYATSIFDDCWWLVLVDSINLEEKDATFKFMHPHGPTNNFYWPHNDDIGYVPFNNFIKTVKTPQC